MNKFIALFSVLTLGLTWSQLLVAAIDLKPLILKDLSERKSLQFEYLLQKWKHQHGVKAVGPLIQIAQNKKNGDSDRYISIMGAAKLGGTSMAQNISPLLKDKSWLVRMAAIKAITALKHPPSSLKVLALLDDKAMVIQSEAIDALGKLQPPGSADALVKLLRNPSNYKKGKAQWVPLKALTTLKNVKKTKPAGVRLAKALRPLLDRKSDSKLLLKTLETMESLTGKKLGKKSQLQTKVMAWKKHWDKN